MPHAPVENRLKQHPLHSSFIQVKNRLAQAGYVCWIAGGAVRDFLLNRTPYDLDLVTDATTEQLLNIFPEAIPVGVQFGVVKIPVVNSLGENTEFDLATFRRESDYQDGRRPSKVDFATPPEDANRRDFTVNAMFWNDTEHRIEDSAGGLDDLKLALLRCVGTPSVRFEEDHLRILRLLRFKYQLGFAIEKATLMAAQERVQLLEKVSGERVWQELEKLLKAIKWSEFFKDDFAKKAFSIVFPNLKPWTFSPAYSQTEGFEFESFFLVLIQHADDLGLLKKQLQTRLKLSNALLKRFETVSIALKGNMTAAEWVFEAEKNESILEALTWLSKLGLQDIKVSEEAAKIFNRRPGKIVDGTDLQGKIPNQEMGEALKKIRLRQLEQPELSKEQLLKVILEKN